MRVSGVEHLDDLVVVAARLAIAEGLRAVDLDFLRVGLGLEQRHNLRDKLIQWHSELAGRSPL
jgi:hypothetical protein